MKNFFALVGLLIVGFAGVGWYYGWYKLRLDKGQNGNVQIQTEVNTHKVAEDSSSFFQKMGKMIGERAKQEGQPAGAPGVTPGPTPPSSAPAPTPPGNAATFPGGWLMAPAKPAGKGP